MESALKDLYQLISVSSPWRSNSQRHWSQSGPWGWPKFKGRIFSDLFNPTQVNQQFQQCLEVDYPPIAWFEQFINQDVSTAIKVVAFLPNVDNLESPTGLFGWFQSKLREVICSQFVASVVCRSGWTVDHLHKTKFHGQHCISPTALPDSQVQHIAVKMPEYNHVLLFLCSSVQHNLKKSFIHVLQAIHQLTRHIALTKNQ